MADNKTTISNLPVDTSVRWAKDQELLKETRPIIADSASIPQHAEQDVMMPAIFPEIETLLGMGRTRPSWARFAVPAKYNQQRRRLFTSQIAPFLGTDEQQDIQIQRIEALSDEEEDDAGQRKKQKETLLKLLKTLHTLNRDLIHIYTRCRQYQKG